MHRSFVVLLLLVLLLASCASPATVTDDSRLITAQSESAQPDATQSEEPAVTEIFVYKTEDEFLQAYRQEDSPIAATSPNGYIRPVPSTMKLHSITLEPHGYTWNYVTEEQTGVHIYVKPLDPKTGSLADELRALTQDKFEQFQTIEVNGKTYMYIDASNVELGFSMIAFLEEEALITVVIGNYNFEKSMIDAYCGVETVLLP